MIMDLPFIGLVDFGDEMPEDEARDAAIDLTLARLSRSTLCSLALAPRSDVPADFREIDEIDRFLSRPCLIASTNRDNPA